MLPPASELWNCPRVIAHRGGGRLAPENTLAALRCGVAQGYRAVEVDVKLSLDEHPYLLHDDTLERTTSGQGVAREWSWTALQGLDVGSWFDAAFCGEPLADLAQLIQYCQAQHLFANIEIKPCSGREVLTGMRIAQAVLQRWPEAPQSVLFSSFSPEALVAAQQQAPMIPRGILFTDLPHDWLDIARELECVAVHTDHAVLSLARVKAMRAAGFRVLAYTVNDVKRAQTLWFWGVDAVFTDALPEFARWAQ